MRYYYKDKTSGRPVYNMKTPFTDAEMAERGVVAMTEKAWNKWHEDHKPAPASAADLAKQEKQNQIAGLKAELAKTDYKAIKFAEGWYTEEEYAPIKAAREEIRVQIRALEGEGE